VLHASCFDLIIPVRNTQRVVRTPDNSLSPAKTRVLNDPPGLDSPLP
jgi:hypothetical protein